MPTFLVTLGARLLVALGVSSAFDKLLSAATSPGAADSGDVAKARASVAASVAVAAGVGAVAGAAAVSLLRRRRR